MEFKLRLLVLWKRNYFKESLFLLNEKESNKYNTEGKRVKVVNV